ncbi:MAG: T9SS type A sorting domain-containing protein [Balneolaceae bacterium]
MGLFGTVLNGNSSQGNPAIQKLALVAPVVTGRSQVGALVGDLSFGAVEQVGIKGGTVTVKGNNGGGMIGALGTGGNSSLPSTARIDKNYATARVIGPDRDGSGYGGLIGLHRERATLTGNFAAGVVTGPTGKIGGLVGHMLKRLDSRLNTNFYLRTSNNEPDIGSRKDGIPSTSIGVELNINQMYQQASYTNANGEDRLGFNGAWIMLNEGSDFPELRVFADFSVLFAGGTGTQADPYQIATAKQLYHVRDPLNPTLHFHQTADIDLGVAPYDTTNNAPGWTPIPLFLGSFNGNGYTISNLRIKPASTAARLGLFATVGDGIVTPILENMTLINPFITNGNRVGALAGSLLNARLTNIHIRGGSLTSISSETVGTTGNTFVGGIAGSATLMITKSSAVGMRIINKDSRDNTGAGGLFGSFDGLSFGEGMNDSYAANKTQGGQYAGGLAGRVFTVTAPIKNSYSASVVDTSGTVSVGGIIGRGARFTPLENSYFNSDSTKTKNIIHQERDGKPLNTTQMRLRASFTNWDFTNTWFIDEGVSFPGLLENRGNQADITGNEGWRMLASPLQSKSIGTILDPLWTQGFTGADTTIGSSNVYFYNEATPITQPWSAPTDTSLVPAPGTGFIVYMYSDDNFDGVPEGFPKRLSRTGTPVSGQVSVDLDYTPSTIPVNDGWNLMGNPYPTTINWDASKGWKRTNLENNAFYVWSDSASNGNGSYQSWNGATWNNGRQCCGKIAPWQGFWVKAKAANAQIVFTDTVRNAGGVLLKQLKPAIPKIDMKLEGKGFSSKSVVMFHEQARLGKDAFDTYKLNSLNPDYLLLGTTAEGQEVMDIQALPYGERPDELEVIIKGSDLNGEFTLNWAPKHLPQGSVAELVDTKTGKRFPLTKAGSYTFSLNEGKTKTKENRNKIGPPASPIIPLLKSKALSARLVVRLKLAVSNEPGEDLPRKVELQQNYPNPFNPVTTINYQIPTQNRVRLEVFDILGRKVAMLVNNELQQAGQYSVQFDARNLASGVYLYRLNVSGTVLTKRLTLIK